MSKCVRFTVLAAAAILCSGAALAQRKAESYPTKPVRLLVPFAPGGGTDIVARVLAQKLTDVFKESVIVDNRAGGGGTIGAETAARAAPDGYTLIMVSASYAANAALFKLSYDPVNDILPIALIGETAFIVTVNPTVPVKSIKELIALAKAKPGSINYASTGTGGITHLASELFDLMAGTKMTHVPYKGTGPAMNDLIGGQVQLIFGSTPAMIPQIKANRLRGVAVTTLKRAAAVPDIPTVAESGVPGYEAVLWYGIWGPKGLPKEVVQRWNSEVRSTLKQPDLKERLQADAIDAADAPPEVFRDIIKRDVAKWTKVVKAANVKVIQ